MVSEKKTNGLNTGVLILLVFLLGLVIGFILAAMFMPEQVIIIQNIPPETLPGIQVP